MIKIFDLLHRLKSIVKSKSSFMNYLFSGIVALILCILTYQYLYPVCTYSNLNDFYVGHSIYINHNKYLDLSLLFIYLALFYCVFFLCGFENIRISRCLNLDSQKYKRIVNIIIIFLFLLCIIKNLSGFLLGVSDTHHYGERFAAYYQHAKLGLKYYSEIMLVHGRLDILPSWFADKILGSLTIENECLASKIVPAFFCLVNLIMSFLIFKKDKVMAVISSGILLFLTDWVFPYSITFVLLYIILLKYYKMNSYLWYGFYYLASFFMLAYHSTIGAACFAASIPLLAVKMKDKPLHGFVFLVAAIITAYLTAGKEICNYLHVAGYYVSSNLYSFGNSFYFISGLMEPFFVILFAYLVLPYFINQFIITKEKNIFHVSLYTIILLLASVNYVFGRLDGCALRSLLISYAVLFVIFPYVYTFKNSNRMYRTKIFLCVMIFIYLFWESIILNMGQIYCNLNNSFANNHKAFSSHVSAKSDSIKTDNYVINQSFIKEIPIKNSYLDLTNAGMNYYYSEAPAAIPYTSFYNIVNSKQDEECLNKLIANPPHIVLLHSPFDINIENVKVPQRVNSVYRWLFTSGNYRYVDSDCYAYLEYSPSDKILPEQLLKADEYLSAQNLHQLPDVWGRV